MLLDGIDKVPLMGLAMRAKIFVDSSPNDRTTFRLLETQRHIRAILLRPNNQGLWIA